MPEEPVRRERETVVTEGEPRDSGAPVAVILGVVVALLLVVLLFFMFTGGNGGMTPGAGDPNDGGDDVELDLDVEMDEPTDDGGDTDGGDTDGGDDGGDDDT